MISLQLVQVGKTRAEACVSQVVKAAQSNWALAMLASTICLRAICCIVVLICAWEGLKTFVTVDAPVIGPLPDTIHQQALPTTESIATQTEDREDPPEVSLEVSSTAAQTDQQFEDLLQTCTSQAQIIRKLQGVVAKRDHDLQAIRGWRPTAYTEGNIYLCPSGKVLHACELCARNRTDAQVITRRPCAYCGGCLRLSKISCIHRMPGNLQPVLLVDWFQRIDIRHRRRCKMPQSQPLRINSVLEERSYVHSAW